MKKVSTPPRRGKPVCGDRAHTYGPCTVQGDSTFFFQSAHFKRDNDGHALLWAPCPLPGSTCVHDAARRERHT
jgi:hypothetical protein